MTKEQSKEDLPVEVAFQVGTPKKSSKKKKKTKERPELRKLEKPTEKETNGKVKQEKGKKEKINEKIKPEKMKEPIKIQQRPKQPEIVKNDLRQGKPPSTNARPDPPKIRILKTDTPSISATTTMTQSSPMESGGKGYPGLQEGHEVFSRLAESTEKLLQTVLSETEVWLILFRYIVEDFFQELDLQRSNRNYCTYLNFEKFCFSAQKKSHLLFRNNE